MNQHIFPDLRERIESFKKIKISEERLISLSPLINYLRKKLSHTEPVKLNYIGINNSHRSLIAQVWTQVAAVYFNLDIRSYSCGISQRRILPQTIKIMKEHGFKVFKKSSDEQVYFAWYSQEEDPITLFSKKTNDLINPPADFAAVFTFLADPETKLLFDHAEKSIQLDFPDSYSKTDVTSIEKWSEKFSCELFYAISAAETRTIQLKNIT